MFSVGKPYSDNWQGEWEYLYSLAKDQPNSGSFSFLPKPAENGFSSWELGSLRISPSNYPDGMWYVQTYVIKHVILVFSCTVSAMFI